MVRFWPFGGRDENSPDSFERVLVKLAAQIQSTSAKLALLHQRSRRYKAIFTIYTFIGYVLFVIMLALVVGSDNVGFQETSALISVPIGIFTGRRLLDLYYNRRIAATEYKLEEFQMEQRATIEKLKAATKYSTTQSLIEKYGGTAGATPTKDSKKSSSGGPKTPRSQRRHSQQQQQLQQLTITPDQLRLQQQMHAQGMPPPYPGQTPQSPQSQQALQSPYEAPNPQALQLLQGQTQPASRQHLQPEEASAPKWYDRILDVVLGEDEMSAKSRFALICKSCRMVNGLAPPGTRSLDDMDVWGCARCGAMNGGRKRGAGMLMPPESIAESELGSEFGDMTTAAPTPEPLLPAARMARSRSQSQAQQQLEESSASTDEEEVLLVKQEPDIAEFEEMSEATATDPKTPKSKRGGRMSAKSSETAN